MWYDISKLTTDQIQHIIVSDYLEGYSTKQIMEMYHLSANNVWMHKTAYVKNSPVNLMTEEEISTIKREDL
jgi:uncharacterized protein YjcR